MTHTEQFQTELKALLKKYDVTMSIEERTVSWNTEADINFHSYAKWDNEGNMITDSIDFTCNYINGDE
jgi:kynurenine formamidase